MGNQRTDRDRLDFSAIGIVHSPHTVAEETPIQPRFARGAVGWAEIFPEYGDGLKDLEGFSHIYLIYRFHRANPMRLIVTPFRARHPGWHAAPGHQALHPSLRTRRESPGWMGGEC
jgi:tRNA (Thr-GGU) A37 N-methylase